MLASTHRNTSEAVGWKGATLASKTIRKRAPAKRRSKPTPAARENVQVFTSDFVITPRLSVPHSVLKEGSAFTFPPHLQDEILEIAPQSSQRASGVELIFQVCESFIVPEDRKDSWYDLSLGMAIRLFDTCLSAPALEAQRPHKSTALLAAACLMAASKCVDRETMEPVDIVFHVRNFEGVEDFSSEDLFEMEVAVCRLLEWDLLRSCNSAVVKFIDFMLEDDPSDLTKSQTLALKNILELTYTHEKFSRWLPSVVAASVLAVASRHLLGQGCPTFRWKPLPFESSTLRSEHQHEACERLLEETFYSFLGATPGWAASLLYSSPQQIMMH